jgi:hypothetical protein
VFFCILHFFFLLFFVFLKSSWLYLAVHSDWVVWEPCKVSLWKPRSVSFLFGNPNRPEAAIPRKTLSDELDHTPFQVSRGGTGQGVWSTMVERGYWKSSYSMSSILQKQRKKPVKGFVYRFYNLLGGVDIKSALVEHILYNESYHTTIRRRDYQCILIISMIW